MNEIITTSQTQLPDTIPDLAKFVLIGRDKLKAVRAEIHAIDKVGMAREVYQQKLEEAQEIAEVVTDAECRMGELIREIPKASFDRGNQYTGGKSHHDENSQKPKSEVIKESGLTQRQAEHFQLMANHPEYVEIAKKKARKEGTVLSRNAVLQEIASRNVPKKPIEQAKEAHEAFQNQKVVTTDDIQRDKINQNIIRNEEARKIRAELHRASSVFSTFNYLKSDDDYQNFIRYEGSDLPNIIRELMDARDSLDTIIMNLIEKGKKFGKDQRL